MPERFTPEFVFLSHLPLIERISSIAGRQCGLSGADAEDFESWVRMRIIEDNYAVLRGWGQTTKLSTYLAAVVWRAANDYVRERRGRWRPSAEAERFGPVAVELEGLVYRDGYSIREAGERLRTASRTAFSDTDLARLLDRLPIRAPLRPIHVSDAVLDSAFGSRRAEEHVIAAEIATRRAGIESAIGRAVEQLPPEDRLIVRLHYAERHTTAQIARMLHLDQKSLYRRIPELRDILRSNLERVGISAREVHAMLSADETTLWRRLEHDELAQSDGGAALASNDLRDFDHPGILGPDGRPLTQKELEGSRIITDVISANEQILRMVQGDPSMMYRLHPRQFEELVAEILDKMGYDISLTPESKDGGFDMYAAWKDGLGEFLYLVECKRYAPNRNVGVQLVRSLSGVVEEKRANGGILVTTSHFTREAREFQRQLSHRLSLRDYLDLQKWLALTVPTSPA